MKTMRQHVRAGRIHTGIWLTLPSADIAELAAAAPLDFLLIDMEHSGIGIETLNRQMQVMAHQSAAPLVRLPSPDGAFARRCLDLGAVGVMAPCVESPEQVAALVESVKYPPQGKRGASTACRAAGFGADADRYMSAANEELLVCVQIETRGALDRLDDIAAVPGIDVLFLGPRDLCMSLGIAGPDDPVYQRAAARVLDAARRHELVAGTHVRGHDRIEPAIRDGFRFLLIDSDLSILRAGLRRAAEAASAAGSAADTSQGTG